MNFVPKLDAPKLDRRSFVVAAATLGGGLALGLRIPFGGDVARAADGAPEVNAWVVVRPDDTVVIRIARSEMGQGSLTGLAQLVAEELECDWSKVTTEYPTPGQNLARKRIWGDMSTGGSRGIRTSHEYVRKGGAAAREMLIAGRRRRMEGAGLGMQRREQRHHPQAVGPHHDLRQGRRCRGEDRAAEGHQAQGPQGLEDRRQAAQAARHRGQGQRCARLRHRPQDAGDARRGDPRLPGAHRQGEELRRRQGRRHARREKGGAGRRFRRRRRRRQLLARPQGRRGSRRSSGTPAKRARSRAPPSPSSSKAGSMPSRPLSATRRATPRPTSPVPSARSRRSTASPTRTTPPWSR